ncbi:MAG: MFS transporter [Acidobacteria bacterium]|nr:MFS transporter [Acidobacteriota bacterium]
MAVNRAQIVDERFRSEIASLSQEFRRISRNPNDPVFGDRPLTQSQLLELFEAQATSRWIDYVARELKAEGKSFYTIGSAGHEGNAMVGMATRPTDMAFLHYRSGGFVFARARQVPGETPVFDTCLSLTASKEDPISGGRHKVWGSLKLNIPPQTSTIASHLPKAMGTALFMDRRAKIGAGSDLPPDSLVVCSFGDASVNHATAVSALNASAWCAFQNLPLPVLYVCEDNGIGISVHTPKEWIQSNYSQRAGLKYFYADGLDVAEGWHVVQQAVEYCRRRRRPTFLHLRTVRMLGHAGSDVETVYRAVHDIEATERLDPLLKTAEHLVKTGVLSPEEVLARYDAIAAQVRAAGQEAASHAKHTSAESVMTPLVLHTAESAKPLYIDARKRREHWGARLPESQPARHMAVLINWGLQDLMLAHRDVVLFGEDVAKKGGVYNVTNQLYERFGVGRVFNTLLDETTILGLAIGAGHVGLTPIPEIQYLAYLHNAIDQIRGEACSLQFFSEDQFRNPMVVRIAGFGYQKGFGGHFHNDNSFAAIRDIPGLVVVTASHGVDAVRAMRTAVSLARTQGAVVIFIEPIALYMTKDLVDGVPWTGVYPEPSQAMPFGEVGRLGDSSAETLVVTYANGTYLSMQAAHDLKGEGLAVDVLDLRFLKPLNMDAVIEAAQGKKNLLVVDEGRETGSISEEIITKLHLHFGHNGPRIDRICGHDTYVPLGFAWEYVLPSRDQIAQKIKEMNRHG